jgi:hypothetical protein
MGDVNVQAHGRSIRIASLFNMRTVVGKGKVTGSLSPSSDDGVGICRLVREGRAKRVAGAGQSARCGGSDHEPCAQCITTEDALRLQTPHLAGRAVLGQSTEIIANMVF